MFDNKKLTLNFKSRISLFICIALICFIFCSLIAGFILYKWGENTAAMRIATILQNIIVFIAPALIISVMITKLPADFLGIRKFPSIKQIILTSIILFLSIPVMNFIVNLNESIVLPDYLKSVEIWMKTMEETSKGTITILLGAPTIGNLIMSVLIVGILTGFSEELFFRGALQNLFITRPLNIHIAIWISAIIFSTLHFQFYGFIPRILLGGFFGYLAVWSGSLWLPIFAHALNNSLVVFSTWLISKNYINFDINKIGATFTLNDYLLIILSLITTTICIIILRRYHSIKA